MNFEKQPPTPLESAYQQVLSQTPLHFACYAGDGELVDLFLNILTRTNSNDDVAVLISQVDALNGWTPAHWAAFYGQLNCLMKLHIRPSVGFDTPTDKTHTSPLHLAARSGAILCLKWLLQCGAAINRQDCMGETPLHKAAKAGNDDSAAMLVSHGASLDMKNQRGCTPSDLAELGDHSTVALYLRRAKEQTAGSLPISDLNVYVPTPCNLPPPHLPHPDHAKYNSFPYVNGHHVDTSLLHSRDTQQSDIIMNGVSIGNGYSNMIHNDTDMLESPSSNSLQNCDKMETMSSVKKSKRPLETMDDDGYSQGFDTSKRRCFDTFGVKPVQQSSGPLLTHSSEMEHQAIVSAQNGYDSSMMCAMHDIFS